MDNPYKLISRRVAFRNAYVTLNDDQVRRPNGSVGPFAWLEMKHGSIVLALSDQHEVWLVNEYKYAIGRPSLELIGGGIDEGETPLEAAKRELREEAGLTARDWTALGVFDAFTTMVNSPNYLFLARGLEGVGRHPEEGEVLEIVKLPLPELLDRIMRSEITHGPTCCLTLKVARWLESAGHGT